MAGSAIMEFALREVGASFDYVINYQGWNKADIKHAALHLPNEQMLIAVKEYGNTGSASIPLRTSGNIS